MKVKTEDLTDLRLDWAVAECLGATRIQLYEYSGRRMIRVSLPDGIYAPWEPSRYWGQGGPIVDREGIYFGPLPDKGIRAYRFIDGECYNIMDCWGASITRCVVAMRCFVASQLGDEVEVPDELMK